MGFINGLTDEEVAVRLEAARTANDNGVDKVLASEALRMVGDLAEVMFPDYLTGLGDELTDDSDFAGASQVFMTSKLFSKMSSMMKWTLATGSKVGKVMRKNSRARKGLKQLVPIPNNPANFV